MSQAVVAATNFEAQFRTLSFADVEMRDLCTDQLVSLPKTEKIELWSVHCGNCKDKIQDTVEDTKDMNLVLINVDDSPDQKKQACAWIKAQHKVSLVDSKNAIRTQLQGGYPIPTELLLKNGIVTQVQIGYWRIENQLQETKNK